MKIRAAVTAIVVLLVAGALWPRVGTGQPVSPGGPPAWPPREEARPRRRPDTPHRAIRRPRRAVMRRRAGTLRRPIQCLRRAATRLQARIRPTARLPGPRRSGAGLSTSGELRAIRGSRGLALRRQPISRPMPIPSVGRTRSRPRPTRASVGHGRPADGIDPKAPVAPLPRRALPAHRPLRGYSEGSSGGRSGGTCGGSSWPDRARPFSSRTGTCER